MKEEKDKKQKIIHIILELCIYIGIICAVTYLVPKYVLERTEVSGCSMEDTLHSKEQICINKLAYKISAPKRFDIIVFYHFFDWEYQNSSDPDAYDYYVKRVIGLPGETVQIVEGQIYIHGEVLEETYGKNPTRYSGLASEPFTLDEGEYFVLGDNRESSQDSRYSVVGNVQRKHIVGKVCFRIWPFHKIGVLK